MIAAFVNLAARPGLASRETPIGDRLPYARHLDDQTLITRNGWLVQVLKIEGFPFETSDDDELNYRKQVRETLLRGAANSRLAIYHHVIRRKVTADIDGDPDEPFCNGLSKAWRATLQARSLFVNDLYLTLLRRPLQGNAGVIDRLFRTATRTHAELGQELRALHAVRERFEATLSPYRPTTLSRVDTRRGRISEPASFLAGLIHGEQRPTLEPSGDLGHAIADRRLTFGLDAMEIGAGGSRPAQFAAMVSMKDYPARSAPGLLDGLMRLPCELTLSESFAFVDRQVALGRMGLALRRLRAADDDAFSLRQELGAARDEVGAGRAAYGEHHLSVQVRADSLSALDAAVAEVQSALTEAGASAVREDVNLEPAFWAQFPGNFDFIARRALISAANFASFAALHNQASGRARDNHWGPAVTLLETTAHGPFHFNFHNGDLGNFTVIGPSGSGKTVLLTFLLAQAQKFRPRTIYFDKDRGAEIFIRATGGRYDVMRPGEPTGFNPLQLPDTPANRAFLIGWLAELLGGAEGPLSPEDKELVADAVDANFAEPPENRQLRYLRELFLGARRPSAGDLAARLRPWCDGGEHAWLFDNPQDLLNLENDRFGFDMTRMLDTPVTRTPAMLYLFHLIEQGMDGRPTIIVIDEGWKALDDAVFVARLKDWEKTIRKRNGIVGFCTQSASDALESHIASAIIEQAATQIFLPNPRARAQDYVGGFRLSEHELALVRALPDTSRCFLVKQGDQSAVARLDLAGLGGYLKVLAGNERSVRRLDALREELGDDPEAWLPRFLDERSEGGR